MRNGAPKDAINVWKHSKPRKIDFQLSNFDDNCSKGGLTAQTCDAALHALTAHEGAPYKESFRLERLQY